MKLSEQEVRKVFKLAAEGWKYIDIGKAVGVATGTVSNIVHRRSYRHVFVSEPLVRQVQKRFGRRSRRPVPPELLPNQEPQPTPAYNGELSEYALCYRMFMETSRRMATIRERMTEAEGACRKAGVNDALLKDIRAIVEGPRVQ